MAGSDMEKVFDALIASARLVYEQGGWSGTSGNWPLVEAFGKLETIKELAPEVYARITEKLPAKEYTDEPCTLCNGTGKSPGKTVGELEADGFRQGKRMAEFIYRKAIETARYGLERIAAFPQWLDQETGKKVDPAWVIVAKDFLSRLPSRSPDPCTCPEIQAKDPRRHFKGCPERKENI